VLVLPVQDVERVVAAAAKYLQLKRTRTKRYVQVRRAFPMLLVTQQIVAAAAGYLQSKTVRIRVRVRINPTHKGIDTGKESNPCTHS